MQKCRNINIFKKPSFAHFYKNNPPDFGDFYKSLSTKLWKCG